MTRVSWQRDRIIAQIRNWASDPRNRTFALEEPRKKIETFLDGGEVPPALIASRLRNLARWHSAMAVVEAEKGDSGNCALSLRRAHVSDWIGLALLANVSDSYGECERQVIAANDAAFAVARAVAISAFDDAERMYRLLLRRLRTSLYGMEVTRLAPLVLRICGSWLGQEPDFAGLKVVEEDAYRRLARLWRADDLGPLAAAVRDSCAVHVERSGEHTDKQTFEFWEQTSQLYAAEVLMVYSLRSRGNQANPVIDHPLLNGPLGGVMSGPSDIADELLCRLRQAASALAPELRIE